ncbi:MAG TPA: beta-galactosidase family protein [Propionibacteriaceae bacterium]|nr:beta-galactosidase family protein [Propionibacteriaceae bacterium]
MVGETDFLLDGAPLRILSGALHYFRVHPDHWADRIESARLMGLNTIETYVPWNEHSPVRGSFDFTGQLDLGRFLRQVSEAGLHAIVRPGPYICAEWDNGGLPAWLSGSDMIVRSSDARYLEAVREYLSHVLDIVAPLQVSRGGPVLMVQVENEYGAYGSDKDYLRALVDIFKAADIDVPLFTCDQTSGDMLANGGLPELLKTATFGARATERLGVLRQHQPTGPLMCAEFWNGWFDHWGTHHGTTDASKAAEELDAILAAGGSVNLYMFHGGTNFGFTNGANDKGIYEPTITSYDYDAPLTEDGHPNAKYSAFKEVISRYAPVPAENPPAGVDAPAFAVDVTEQVPLLDVVSQLGEPTDTAAPPTTDDLGHYRGFSLYITDVSTKAPAALVIGEVRDRAIVHLDGKPLGTLSRENHEQVLSVPQAESGQLQILVEDQGRVNYGMRIGEPKGLLGPITLAGQPLEGWRTQPVEMDLERVRSALQPTTGTMPRAGSFFARAQFDLAEPADLYLATDGWTKGVAFVNGFHLGRYWSRGPTRTLYVPRPVTRAGVNELIIFELHGTTTGVAHFVARLDLGPDEA